MKKTIYLIAAFLMIGGFAFKALSQTEDQKSSIAVQPPFMNISPSGTLSEVVITDGFDNIFLGTDFGEPYIATNPRDPLNSVCAFNINNLYHTLDGYNWTKTIVSFPGYGVLGDPVMCYDSLGNCYYAQLYQNGATYGIAVMKSTTKGASWIGAYNVASTNVGLSDKEWITADQTAGPYSNYLYVGWRQFGATGMRFVRSTDKGVTWSTPLTLSGGQGAYVAVGPNGNIQGGSVYFAAISGSLILVNRSTDGGATFSPQEAAVSVLGPGVYCAGRYTVKNCIRNNEFPRMAADNSYTSTRGNVYVVYAANPLDPNDNADIFLIRSTDYGTTWSTPLRVNDDVTTTDQWLPSVSVDNTTGKVFVCWYDSRMDPASNLMTRLYAAVSTNGGVSFTANENVSNVTFNPNSMAVGQGTGQANYIGDYIGNSAIFNSSYNVWMDGRNSSLGSYVGYYPDYAMTVNPSSRNIVNGDSTTFTVTIPAIKGPLSDRIKFSVSVDTLPVSGSLQFTFQNGKDTISTFPDSLMFKVKAIGNVTPRLYKLNIKGSSSTTGSLVHMRNADLLVNVSQLTIGTNRNGICDFKVNGVQYNSQQSLVFPNATNITIQAISPKTVGFNRYVFVNWSDAGDTTHNITLNSNQTITANYKAQYRLAINSTVGNTFGDNYHDSGTTVQFGVLSRNIVFNGNSYTFRGWTGTGTGAYTSPDSTGNDTAVSISLNNPIVENARWGTPIGIQVLGQEIPKEYKLWQNYPNPFNPSTNIKFDIIKAGLVRVIIYDLLGREVERLVNQEMIPGSYKVDFSAVNYASGLYFYRIESGEFVDIKKMLIVK
ncbi:MAG: T9SS type A sorting domain-containing protein [Ignavibacteria bacterium]|nr:T9SS type A sorting domain-containing protein [Ignavibacteria bacterium]